MIGGLCTSLEVKRHGRVTFSPRDRLSLAREWVLW